MRRRTQLSLAIVAVSLLALVEPAPRFAHAADPAPLASITFVATDGDDSQDCATAATRCATLQRALANLADGGEVRLAGGRYQATTTITRSAVIAGGYLLPNFIIGNAPTVLDGQFQGSTLNILGPIQVWLRQITVTGGLATRQVGGQGGGIYATGADVVLDRVEVRGNIASAADEAIGGGLYIRDGSLTASWSTITSNLAVRTQFVPVQTVPPHGAFLTEEPRAAIALPPDQGIDEGSGGGIYAINASIALNSSLLADNRTMKIGELRPSGMRGASLAGTPDRSPASGGLYAENCVVASRDTGFTANRVIADSDSGEAGGAIMLIDSRAEIDGGEIRDNQAGAAVDAPHAGSGIDILGGDTLVTNVGLWNNNPATDTGQAAGILLRPGATTQASAAITLTNVLLAQHRGAALALLPGENSGAAHAEVRYATLVSNTIGLQAGAAQSIAVVDSVIAGSDLAAQALVSGTIALQYTDRYGNRANADGNVAIGPAGDLALAPGFMPSSDMTFPLAVDSPLVDRGTPVAEVASDFEGQPRVIDGNADGIALPDLGWDELARSAAAFGPDQTLFAMPGQVLTTTLELRNEGLQFDDFLISAEAPPGWRASVQPNRATLGQRGRVRLTVVIAVPSTAPLNTQWLVLIRARGQTSAATARIFVDVGEP